MNIGRRAGLVIAATGPCMVAGARQHAQAPRPNIILIQADDLGYGDLSVYGQSRFQTPSSIDWRRTASGSPTITRARTVCAPSRGSLMTGLHTGHSWVRGNLAGMSLRDEDRTIATTLRESGYRTALIGKWGLGGSGSPGRPDRKGFEYSFGYLVADARAPAVHRSSLPQCSARRGWTWHDYSNDLFTRETMSFIENRTTGPFFVYLNYTVPHAELRVPDDSMQTYKGRFPETPFANAAADARRPGPDEPSLGYRSQPSRTPRLPQ